MKTILQSHLNITNLHPFLKLFQSRAGKAWQMTEKHLSTALMGRILLLTGLKHVLG